MKQSPKEKLLRDILKEASDGFRQEVLQASLKEMRRRKSESRIWLRLPLAIAAAFVLSVGLLFLGMPHRTSKEDHAQQPGILETPVSAYAQMEIVTNLGRGMVIVESRQYQSLIVQNSSIRQPLEILGDPELLALFPNEPAGLVLDSQGIVQLVFLDSRDRIFRQ